jgi:YHS domain-containing protein
MVRIIIIAVLIYLAYRLVKIVFQPTKRFKSQPGGKVIDEMVQDPLCKTYIPRNEAVKRQIRGQAYLFCSEECASKFEKQLEEQG